MDTRLTWVMGDDDVLKQTGQAFPLSPDWSIGDRKQYRLFFDNLNSRFGGRENLTHLALYKKMPGFIKDLDTEASLIMRLDIAALASNSGNVNQAFYDAGSYIRGFYHTARYDDPKKVEGLGFTLWPIDTDRFRLGYLYDLDWGGTAAPQPVDLPAHRGHAPGAKISYEHPLFNAFVASDGADRSSARDAVPPAPASRDHSRRSDQLRRPCGYRRAAASCSTSTSCWLLHAGKFDLPDVRGMQCLHRRCWARLVLQLRG